MLFDENHLVANISPLLSPILAPIVAILAQFYYKIVHLVYVVVNLFVPKLVVPLPNEEDEKWIFCSATELGEKIRQNEITASQLLEIYIRRIETVNDVVNAIVQRNYAKDDQSNDEARKCANQIDEYLANLDKNSDEFKQLAMTKPILGVLFSVKDHMNVTGLKTTVGLKCFENNKPAESDAGLVKNLREAGGIPIVMTNVPEAVMWFEGINTVYGRTLSPYDSRKCCGGSSSGEAALLGGAGTVIGIGTDIAGSIRAPCLFNGIFGLKPGPGLLVDMSGFTPSSIGGEQAQMVGIGPMCRYASDLNMMFKIFIGPENSQRLRLDEPVDLSTVRFYSMAGLKNKLTSPSMDSDVFTAFNNAVTFFEEKFNKAIIPVDFQLANYTVNYWFESFSSEGAMPIANFFTGFKKDKKLEVFPELSKWFKGESEHITAALLACLVEEISPWFKVDRPKVSEMRAKLRKQILDMLGDNGILIWPSFPRSGYYHNELLWQFLTSEYTAIWNTLKLPAIACPMGLNDSGFPTGIQMVTSPENERLLIAAAQELEHGGFKWEHPRP